MSETSPDIFKAYTRKCGAVFAAVVCGTLLMVAASYAPISNHRIAIALVLTAAACNASVVAAYLMHLIGERKMIFTVLAFTVVFFIGLMGLSIWASQDIPTVVAPITR